MQSVRLHVFQPGRGPVARNIQRCKDPLEQRDVILASQITEDGFEFPLVFQSEIRWRLMSDQEYGYTACSRRVENVVQVLTTVPGIDSPQEIVSAEKDNERVRIRLKRPVNPGSTPCRRITGHTRILDDCINPLALEPAIQLGNQTVILVKAEPLDQAVAEGHNASGFCTHMTREQDKRRNCNGNSLVYGRQGYI